MNSTILMYIVNNNQEMPANPLPNTAYYVVGKEVIIYDNLGQKNLFTLPVEMKPTELEVRMSKCEESLSQITNYLMSFKPFMNGNN